MIIVFNTFGKIDVIISGKISCDLVKSLKIKDENIFLPFTSRLKLKIVIIEKN